MDGEEDDAVVDAVCCCLVPGKKEDEGVSENFLFGKCCTWCITSLGIGGGGFVVGLYHWSWILLVW